MRIVRGADPGPFQRPRDYVSHLRILFRNRCAYCLTPDDRLGGEEAMEVDHFRPRRYADLIFAWSNLYYSCRTCNNHKGDHPTQDEESQGLRFVDPCAEDPDEHFRLTRDPKFGDYCRVVPSPAAEYTVFQLRFNRRRFLQDFWRDLDAEERRWTRQMNQVMELQSQIADDDSTSQEMIAECQSKIAFIRSRRPFPLEA